MRKRVTKRQKRMIDALDKQIAERKNPSPKQNTMWVLDNLTLDNLISVQRFVRSFYPTSTSHILDDGE